MTHRRHRLRATLALLAATAITGMPARAQQLPAHARLEVFPQQPVAAGRAPEQATASRIAALLHLPAGWSVLDAAAILLDDPAWPTAARDRLREALLDQGAAVMELDLRVAPGKEADSAFAAQPAGRSEVLPGMFGALLALKGEAGAGLVVAFGYGATGEAALPAAEDAVAVRHFGLPDWAVGPRFAALGKVGPGRPVFAAGPALPADEQWPVRAPLLCAIMADAVAGARYGDCLAALLPHRRGPAADAAGLRTAGR